MSAVNYLTPESTMTITRSFEELSELSPLSMMKTVDRLSTLKIT